ncbi:MAG: PorP/SprF family type IX secretion system membrane protein [Bacteroidales bacterium]|jgi:type IX secretion system PorP/SprF family membrane protein|nr:PorP/SprF family type IX secretion system membrane protein [Bacteroidales bacterium]
MSVKINKYLALRYGTFALLLQCILPVAVSAQDAVHSQFMFDALSVNPGLAGINEYNKLTGGFRDQWVQMDNAYVTYFVSYDQKIQSINSGVGLQVYRDVAGGVYSRTSAELFYNYQFQVTKNLLISPGLQVAVVQRAMDASGLTLPDQNPYTGSGTTETLGKRSAIFPDFGFGAIANYSDRYSFGIAVHHLNAPIETLSEINKKRTPMSLSAHFISYFPLRFGKFDKREMVFSPGAYFRQQQYQNFFSVGMNVAYDPVFAGIWMRAASGFHPESTIFMIGLEQINYRIVYNYDYKLASAKGEFPGTGAHEITLTWKIHPKEKMRTIKCSKYSLKK